MEDWDGLMLLYDLEHAELEADAGQRIFHAQDDAFLLSDTAFERRFRLTKRMTDSLIQRLEDLLPEPTRKSAINVQTSVSWTQKNQFIVKIIFIVPPTIHIMYIVDYLFTKQYFTSTR